MQCTLGYTKDLGMHCQPLRLKLALFSPPELSTPFPGNLNWEAISQHITHKDPGHLGYCVLTYFTFFRHIIIADIYVENVRFRGLHV